MADTSKKLLVDDRIINEVIQSCDAHVKKYGMRKMSSAELKELTGAK